MIHLITEIFPPAVGGSGKWFNEVFRRFPSDQYRVVTKQRLPNTHLVDASFGGNIHRIPFELSETGAFSWAGISTYRKLIKEVLHILPERNPRIPEVIVAGRMVPEGWVATSVARCRRARVVCFAHGEEINKSQRSAGGVMSSRQHRWMGTRIASLTDHWIANSQNTCNILTEQWGVPIDKVSVIHPGVDTDFFHPANRDSDIRLKLGWNDRFVILTVGRLQKRKGHDHLIKALPELSKRYPGLLYVIIGDGHERQPLQDLVHALHLEDTVVFLGEVDDNTVRECYQHADLFVLPNRAVGSDIEGFGMVLVEAGACGTPVCAGLSGGTSETMLDGKTGFLLNCSTPESLATDLGRVLARQDLPSIGLQAAKFCRETFGWPQLAERLYRTLESVRADR